MMSNKEINKNQTPCPFCNSKLGLIYVQSHYQCLNCKQVTDPCCGGEVCGNYLLEIDKNSNNG